MGTLFSHRGSPYIEPLLSLCLLILLDKKFFKINLKNFNLLLIFIITIFIPIYFNINFLNQNNFNSQIPVIISTWVQFRWMAIYIIPIIFLTGLIVENIKINRKLSIISNPECYKSKAFEFFYNELDRLKNKIEN